MPRGKSLSDQQFAEIRGIVYVGTGKKYIDLALQSIRYLREVEPDESVTLVLDDLDYPAAQRAVEDYGIELKALDGPEYSFMDKVRGIRLSPYQRTIFLDCDTIPIRPFADDLVRSLDDVDVVALPGFGLNHSWERESLSPALSQFNTGVIGLRMDRAGQLLDSWESEFRSEADPWHDQPSFRVALYRSGLRWGALPPDFNFMGHGKVKRPRILHFTAWRRKQSFYTSPTERAQLIEYFTQPNAGGIFNHFAEAFGVNNLHSNRGPGRLSWWVSGLVRLSLFRLRRQARQLRQMRKAKR